MPLILGGLVGGLGDLLGLGAGAAAATAPLDIAAASAPLDILAGGAAAGTAGTAALGDVLAPLAGEATGALTAGAGGGAALGASLPADVTGGALSFADTTGGGAGSLPSWLASPTGDLGPVSPYTAPALPDTGAAVTGAPTANLGAAASASGAPIDLSGGGAWPTALDVTQTGPGVAAPTNLLPTAGGGAPAAAGGGITSNLPGWAQTGLADLKAVAPIAGIGGLGYNLFQGYENQQAQKKITNQINATAAQEAAVSTADTAAAQPLINSGTQLTQYLTTGTLPPAFQAQVTQQVQAAKAAIIQGYATRGQSTNPSDNSALAQDLANVDQQALTLQANLESTLSTAGTNMISTANQLLASGASAASISGELPVMIAQLNLNLSNATSSAISNFAAALNGGKMTTPGGTASPVPQVNLAQANAQQPLKFTG